MCPIINQMKINDNKDIMLPYVKTSFEEIG